MRKDKDGVAEAGDMSEEDEDHVGCNGEGCPNKCALGVDCGHVEEAGEDCGGVGHGRRRSCPRVHCSNGERKGTDVEIFTSRIQS